jgi:hypothetical protein
VVETPIKRSIFGAQQMNEADKAYLVVRMEEEEQHDPWEFLAQQIKGIIAFAAIVTGVWMLVAAVVLK